MKKLNITAAVLSAAASTAGIFSNIYTDIPWAVSQMKGQDAVTIFAAAVLIIVSLRKGPKAVVISAGINAYLIYTYFFYAIETLLNPFFHAYLAIVLLSLIALIKSVSNLKKLKYSEVKTIPKTFSVIYLSAIASVLAFLWNADIFATLAGSPILETPTAQPLTIVYVFDLTFVIPAVVYTLYLLKKNKAFGIPLCGIMLVKCTTMGAALLGMTIGVWFYGFELEGFLAVFWCLIAILGLISITLFLKGSRIHE